MSTKAYLDKTGNFYTLTAVDGSTVVDQLETEASAREMASDLDMVIVQRKKQLGVVGDQPLGSLFRIKDYWYRKTSIDGSSSVVVVVGENRDAKLKNSEPITEISVLSLT